MICAAELPLDELGMVPADNLSANAALNSMLLAKLPIADPAEGSYMLYIVEDSGTRSALREDDELLPSCLILHSVDLDDFLRADPVLLVFPLFEESG